jgi:hypothetical protein
MEARNEAARDQLPLCAGHLGRLLRLRGEPSAIEVAQHLDLPGRQADAAQGAPGRDLREAQGRGAKSPTPRPVELQEPGPDVLTGRRQERAAVELRLAPGTLSRIACALQDALQAGAKGGSLVVTPEEVELVLREADQVFAELAIKAASSPRKSRIWLATEL